MAESTATTALMRDLRKVECHVQKLAGSFYQTGVPDLYVLNARGRHVWIEMKYAVRKPSDVIGWLTLFGSRGRALQDEFTRAVCERDPLGACVVVAHPELWALYQPIDRPKYKLCVTGRDAVLEWILRG